MRLTWRPAWTDIPELMDQPGHHPAVLEDNLRDLRRVNQILGGTRLSLRALRRLSRRLGDGGTLSLLDVGAGGADIPAALRAWAATRKVEVRFVAVDVNPEILSVTNRLFGAAGAGRFVVADGRDLPFDDGAFAVAHCSLVLHHLPPGDAIAMLREMRRVARDGIVVNDIVRWWPGYWGAWLLSRGFSRNPLTRNDGPLSVRRAYTRREMRDLAARAGLEILGVDGFLGYRVAIAARGSA